jgi:hypothetical protein
VPFQRQSDLWMVLYANTDPNRKFSINADLIGWRLLGFGAEPGGWGWGTDVTAIWHPIDALETRLDGSWGNKLRGARWLETDGDTALFGWQNPTFLSVTLRQQVVLTPTLTVQVYAQLFSDALQYTSYYTAPIAGRSYLPTDALTPINSAGNASSHGATLNLEAVVRWEYRLGSTLYFVYTHSQQERALGPGQAASASFLPQQLFQGPASDSFLVKWTYWLSV